MKYIEKKSEPVELSEFRANGGHKYTDDAFPTEQVQKKLIHDQHGLCAYCMSRISREPVKGVGAPKMIIEHYLPRNGSNARPEFEIDYNNMLGVCRGGKDNQKTGTYRELFCDQSKHEGVLKRLNPVNNEVESLIQFLDNGTITATYGVYKEDVEQDIKLLNLNEKFTRINRENILFKLKEEYRRLFRRHKDKTAVRDFLLNELRRWQTVNAKSQLQPYCLVAIQFINEKLNRISQL